MHRNEPHAKERLFCEMHAALTSQNIMCRVLRTEKKKGAKSTQALCPYN